MFKDCHKLESLDLSSFKTNNVKDFEGMFMNCLNLKLLNLKNFKLLTNDTFTMFKNINKEDCKLIVNDEKIKKIILQINNESIYLINLFHYKKWSLNPNTISKP